MDVKRPLIIYDAIHQVMEFPHHFAPLLLDLVNLPSVQRLRRIKQQSLSDLVFPTATHTRLSHALGTAFLSGRMLRQIKKQGFLKNFDEKDEKILMSASLLHDIGHGPFSHTFEIFLKRIGIDLKHEEWTESILFSEPFRAVFSKHGLEDSIQLIAHIITKKGGQRKECLKNEKAEWHLAADIISSQLDADRLDYLLRDSHFCGVAYGNYDLNWLLSCLTCVEHEDKPALGISAQGIGSVEHFLMARRLMYQNIYCYPKIVAFDRLIVEFLIELVKLYPAHKAKIAPLLGHFLSQFFDEITRSTSKKEFKKSAFELYLTLSDDDIWIAVRDIFHFLEKTPDFKNVHELADRLYHHKTPKAFHIQNLDLANQRLPKLQEDLKLTDLQQWKCNLVNVSVSLYSTLENPILVQETLGDLCPITHHSELIRTLSDRIEPSTWLMVDKTLLATDGGVLDDFLTNVYAR